MLHKRKELHEDLTLLGVNPQGKLDKTVGKQKYQLTWVENWSNTESYPKREVNLDNGMTYKANIGGTGDKAQEIECIFTFYAKDDAEAKKMASEWYDNVSLPTPGYTNNFGDQAVHIAFVVRNLGTNKEVFSDEMLESDGTVTEAKYDAKQASELIGSGKLPNRYYVVASNTFAASPENDNVYGDAWDVPEFREIIGKADAGKAIGQFDTFPEAFDAWRKVYDAIPEEPTKGQFHMVTIEDHISGVIYTGSLYATKKKWGWVFDKQEDDDTSFTSKTLGYDIRKGEPKKAAEPEETDEAKLSETGEPDQDYDHEFFDALVKELAKAGFRGATHREFDKYQGVYLNVPGHTKFWVAESFNRGVISKGDREKPWTGAVLISPSGKLYSATRGDYFMKPKDYVFKGYTLVLKDQVGKSKTIKNPKLSDLPDLDEVRSTFTYEPGTVTDIYVFTDENVDGSKVEVSYKDGKVDASQMVKYLKAKPMDEAKGGCPQCGGAVEPVPNVAGLPKVKCQKCGWEGHESALSEAKAISDFVRRSSPGVIKEIQKAEKTDYETWVDDINAQGEAVPLDREEFDSYVKETGKVPSMDDAMAWKGYKRNAKGEWVPTEECTEAEMLKHSKEGAKECQNCGQPIGRKEFERNKGLCNQCVQAIQ